MLWYRGRQRGANLMAIIGQTTIIGTGLLGTSLGLAMKARSLATRLVGLGHRRATLDQAIARGAFDAVTTDPAQALADATLVVIAVPLSAFDAVLARVAGHQHDGMVITDVGSTKVSVLEAAGRHLPRPGRFVGAHPMAGAAQSGPEAASADLFDGRPCVLTPARDTAADALETVRSVWGGVGMTLIELGARTHDEQAATVSHVPHLVARLLVALAEARGGWPLASTGFRDMTRLAGGDPALWRDIVDANRQPIVEALGEFRDQLETLTRLIDAGDDDALQDWLGKRKIARDEWYETHFRE